MDIDTVISELIGEYVKANSAYDKILSAAREYPNTYDLTSERLELSGLIQGLRIALVALGQDMTVIDSQFSIDGV